MRILDLTNQYDGKITTKQVIDYLKSEGYKIKSHMQEANEECINKVYEHFGNPNEEKTENKEQKVIIKEDVKVEIPKNEMKQFNLDDLIPCRSVVPWEIIRVGTDGTTVYSWTNFGDVDYVRYRDLQAFRKKDLITDPKVIIEDSDLCYQWRRELGDTYKYFLGVEYPEEFFEVSDEEFTKFLTSAPKVLQEVIKTTALEMIRATNYPTVQKLDLIDKTLGTCLKDLL